MFDAKRELNESASKSFNSKDKYDVFLSHRYLDAKEVLALKTLIESFGLSVFVDWIESPELDRSRVTKETAAKLREAMERSASLLYAISDNSQDSKWMPWELGYSDGLHGRIAIVPIAEQETTSESYLGQEYLGLYPYVSLRTASITKRELLWVQESGRIYVALSEWLEGAKPTYHG
jgi:hypothetical protein